METLLTVAAGGALFVLPGYALLRLGRVRLPFHEMLCAAAGVSIAAVALVQYGAAGLRLRLAPWPVWAILALCGAAFVQDAWPRFTRWRGTAGRGPAAPALLALVFVLALAPRLWMVRGIAYPLWTDSYHHTIITQLIVDQGALPVSYEPYMPTERFTYHFGFHALAAWFHWLTGIPVPRSVLLVGQLLNALVVPTTYLFVRRLFGGQGAGLAAAFIVGLASHMPALYVNWGRYPQLAGQILLPALIVLTIDALAERDERPASVAGWLLAGAVAAGLFLTHIRIFLFYLVFAVLWLGYRLAQARRSPAQVKGLLVTVLVMAATMLVIDAPWLARFFGGLGGRVAARLVQGYNPPEPISYFQFDLQQFVAYGMTPVWWALAGLAVAWAAWRRNARALLVLAWALLLLAAANLHRVGIPPLFSTLIVIIWIYLPVAALVGWLAAEAGRWLRGRMGGRLAAPLWRWALAGAVAVAGLPGMFYVAGRLADESFLLRPADLKAVAWVQANVPADALFYVRPFFWTPGFFHGIDAGYWLPYLAGRQTIIPPETYAADAPGEFVVFANQRAQDFLAADTPERAWQLMAQYHVTHVYLGSRDPALVVSADFFLAAPELFETLYAQDDVWIFKVAGPSPG